ncbi:MAG: hypothetical protein IKY75_05395 [Bacteroidaceae bacterium]|nr:hypothetical protein [Bacteroidaceae bacterium]
MNDIKYKYALNEQGDIVSIHEVTNKDKSTHTYYCISCGKILIPRIGSKRTPHFAHKCNNTECNGETYLHKLAKHKIKEKFEQCESFIIRYYCYDKCINHNTCPIYVDYRCTARNQREFNLKEYYNTCKEEVKYDGYIADLLLTHSKKTDREPIFIEIHVKHKSTAEKKSSGHRIIELTVKSESDIEFFVNNAVEESLFADEGKAGFTQFYGFKSDLSKDCFQCNIPKFFLYKSGKIYAEYINCNVAFNKKHKNFEICFLTDYINRQDIIRYGGILAIKNVAPQKFCQFCKYHSNEYPHICRLYKKFNLKQYPNPMDATNCNYYRKDNEELGRIESSIKQYSSHSGEINGIKYMILT